MSAPQFERRRHMHWWNLPAIAEHAPDLFQLPSEPVDTSEAAAQAIQPAARSIRETVFAYMASQGARGATCGELCAALDLNASTARPRLRELEGNAPWCRGQLPARIVKTSTKRGGMRCYVAL